MPVKQSDPKQLYSHLQCARHWPCPQKVINPVSNSPKQSEGPRQSFTIIYTCFWPQPLLLFFFPIIHINSQTKYHSCHFERQEYPVTGTWVSTLHFPSCFSFSPSPSLLRWRTRHLKFEPHGAPATVPGWIPVVEVLHQDLTLPTDLSLARCWGGMVSSSSLLLSPPCLAMCEKKHIRGFLENCRQGLHVPLTSGWNSNG